LKIGFESRIRSNPPVREPRNPTKQGEGPIKRIPKVNCQSFYRKASMFTGSEGEGSGLKGGIRAKKRNRTREKGTR